MLKRRSLAIGTAAALLPGPSRANPPGVRIYAAMTFRAALDAVLAAYRATGGDALGVYGATPELVRQLEAGAPADILMTANPDWMDEAAKRSLIQPQNRANLLTTDLVLAGPPGTPQAGSISRDFDLAALLGGGGRIAMCDPERDPAGRYARQSLVALGFWPMVSDRLAITENSLGAVTLVDRGEVRAAVCFATDMASDANAGIVGRFPPESHAPIIYPVSLTRAPPSPMAAEALAFLRSGQAMGLFKSYGYRAPAGSRIVNPG